MIANVPSRFSWIIDKSVPRDDAAWNQPLFANEHFVVLPSKGSLVPGWLLIVPRRRMLNLSSLSATEKMSLQQTIEHLCGSMAQFEGDPYCFEHGSAFAGSATGCGVDQAHLHLVPLKFDLVEVASRTSDGDVEWPSQMTAQTLTQLPTVGEYIAVWQPITGAGCIGCVNRSVSQWMRRLIAREMGVDAEWNYQSHPQTRIVQQTLEGLKHVFTVETV